MAYEPMYKRLSMILMVLLVVTISYFLFTGKKDRLLGFFPKPGISQKDIDGAEKIAQSSRQTPRIANRLLKRVRDFAQVKGDGMINEDIVNQTFDHLEIDNYGLEHTDRKILEIIIEKFSGGPVGVSTIAASLSEQEDTIEYVYEPYLLQLGFLQRTPRGRKVTKMAYDHLGIEYPEGNQNTLL